MGAVMEVWQNILISLLSSSSIAWIFLKLFVKDVAREVVEKKLLNALENYVTKEDMQIERKKLLEVVEQRFLSIVAFREFEKRIDSKFDDSSKRFDKIDGSLEHITDLIINQR